MASFGRNEGMRVLDEFVTVANVPEGRQPSQVDRGSLGGLRGIGSIRDAFFEQRRQAHRAEGWAVTDDDLITEWYCSEEFAQLMSIQGHLAKRQILQTNGKL